MKRKGCGTDIKENKVIRKKCNSLNSGLTMHKLKHTL
jgi:hypothetical protein